MRRHASPLAITIAFMLALAGGDRAVAEAAGTGLAAPAETQGQIDGKPARYVAAGDNVLIAAAEADRLGIDYRHGKSLDVGGTTLWVVTLGSVTIDGKARLFTQAGVVASIPQYFAALQAHAVETYARSHQIEVRIDGQAAQAFDFGGGNLLVSLAEAERVGLRYREGRRDDVDGVAAWRVERAVSVGGQDVAARLVVTDPEPYFKALQARATGAAR